MIEIEVKPHDTLDFVQKLTETEYEYQRSPIGKAITGNEYGLDLAFSIDELEEIAEYLMVYVKHNREEE